MVFLEINYFCRKTNYKLFVTFRLKEIKHGKNGRRKCMELAMLLGGIFLVSLGISIFIFLVTIYDFILNDALQFTPTSGKHNNILLEKNRLTFLECLVEKQCLFALRILAI